MATAVSLLGCCDLASGPRANNVARLAGKRVLETRGFSPRPMAETAPVLVSVPATPFRPQSGRTGFMLTAATGPLVFLSSLMLPLRQSEPTAFRLLHGLN